MTDFLRVEDRAVRGTQALLVICKAPAGTALVGKKLLEAGALTVVGTYECDIELQGLDNVEVHLMPSAVSGAFAPSLVSYYANGRKPKDTVAGVNFVAGTRQSLTFTAAVLGVKKARVVFTIPGGGSITFDPSAGAADPVGATPAAQAEYNGA